MIVVSNRRLVLTFILSTLVIFSFAPEISAQNWLNVDGDIKSKNHSMFRPIEDWPDPTVYRTASGAPGANYWQQRADYVIETTLDVENHVVLGSETITYHNQSPDKLTFLWLQLDQNVRSFEHSRTYESREALPEVISPRALYFMGLDSNLEEFDGGYEFTRVQIENGNRMQDADYSVRNTLMKVNLPEPLESGGSVDLDIDWSFKIPNSGRGAKELVNDGWLYEIAQWFPRMSVYDDVNGWQTEQFFGLGEFYLNFGNYDVKITVPWNHIVDATGILQNPKDVLTETQRDRLETAVKSQEPTFIVSADEVMSPESRPASDGMLTWHYKAENVRDFAWVSSKTFVWDAAGFVYEDGDTPIVIHSLYPRDAMPLWDKVSTRAVIVTLEKYGEMSLRYPYPKASNVHGPIFGMEYPMLAFCGARPNPDGSYSDQLERALIGVTIHEVGHNWVPMIIASDERKHTWMDEGLNTFMEYYSEQHYAQKFQNTDIWTQTSDGTFPSTRGPAKDIVEYMRDPNQVPIMTESDVIPMASFGNNGYAKPAAGLVMLREQILGEDVFDDAFREYSRRWAFKHPQPSDFFRTMEEASGENLNWFWRGWFHATYANDQAVAGVTLQPRNSMTANPNLGENYYRIEVSNEGQLLLPIHIDVTFDDGSTELMKIPADAWRRNELTYKKGFFTDKKVMQVVLDPNEVFADVNRENNTWISPTVVPQPGENK